MSKRLEKNYTYIPDNNKTNIKATTQDKASNKKKIVIIVTLSLVLILAIIYSLIANYYTSHFYSNTIVNNIDASNKTIKDVQDAINNELRNYELKIEGRDNITDSIMGYNIEIRAVFDDSLDRILKDQKGYDWPKYLFDKREIDIETMIDYDEELFELNFSNLLFFKDDLVTPPANAYLDEFDGTSFKIVPEVYGNKAKENIVRSAVVDAIQVLEPSLSLEDIDCYEKPTIFKDNPDLVELANNLNKPASARITYEFGDDIEVVDGNMISEWLIVDENNQVTIDTEGVKEFVDYIGRTYNTFGKTRTLKTTFGPTIEVKGGDYGWWLNRAKEVEELTELIKAGAKLTKEPVYLQKAAHYGEDDVGDTYVEVNITAQYLYFYKDGELILESDFVSGNLAKGYVNPTGTFPVQYKERNAILRGEDYASPVDYWMPFYRDIGFHDASWRNTFGGNIYKTNGSRGCINLPHEAARIMYENIERGVAVFVYELPGTERTN